MVLNFIITLDNGEICIMIIYQIFKLKIFYFFKKAF